MAHPYACGVCGAEVTVHADGSTERHCPHDFATIIAERTAVLFGDGGAADLPLLQRALAALRRLIAAFR